MTVLEHDIKERFPQIKEIIIHAEPIGGGEDEWPDLK
jgi:divalent metal cation (Fe/Co/Zn/Cd) transporter